MRTLRTVIVAAGSAVLLGLGLVSAAPASASDVTVSVLSDSYYQYLKTCPSSTDCNVVSSTELNFFFQISRLVSYPVTLDYKVTNGTAVDGEDFNVPMTGQVTIAANNSYYDLQVPLVNEGEFGITTTFTIAITKVETKGVGVTGGPATGTIDGGNVALDCSYSNPAERSMSLTCDGRPAAQAWHMNLLCAAFKIYIGIGNEVTGEGTSSATCPGGINTGEGFLVIDSG
jgi:hypothetical protein